MSGYRLDAPAGTAIDRSRPLRCLVNDAACDGFAGDTLGSALIASGARVVARSFKYHRPRGIMSCGLEEPTGLLDIDVDGRRTANTRVTAFPLTDGLVAKAGNAWPGVRFDVGAVNSWIGRYLTAGFYYKTFMWPDWRWFEPSIRRMAGLGRAGEGPDPDRYDERSLAAEVLVIGGGVAGLEAAVAAADTGRDVVLLEGDAWLGGWAATVAGDTKDVDALVDRARRAGVAIHLNTVAVGIYDHGFVAAIEEGDGFIRERLLRIRATRIVLATGALDRPLLFPDNDRPGVLFAHAAERYARHFGAAVGRRIVVATACDDGVDLARRLSEARLGVVAILDRRAGDCVVGVAGKRGVEGVLVAREDGSDRRRIDADALVHTAGPTPNVSLYSQAGGGLRWDTEGSMFVPSRPPTGVAVVGACAGAFDRAAACEHARAVGRGEPGAAPIGGLGRIPADIRPPDAALGRRHGPIFVDLQNDVTVKDVTQAARENYRSVEHLKRYTTTGMATDQGKTSNVNALVTLARATGRQPGEVGTTKFRPPYTPVTLGTLAAGRLGARHRPLKRMPGHAFHVARDALFEEFGGWCRPAGYPLPGERLEATAEREALHTRSHASLFEGSPLGKIEVIGPDAAVLLDLMYVGTMSTLAVGSARYGVLLDENGIVVDDGIVMRLAPDHFWVNTTSGGVEATAASFEEWLQCEYPGLDVFIQPVVSAWGNVTIAGPKAWDVIEAAGFDPALSPRSMKHMSVRELPYGGTTARVLRASFSGELGYEINVPSLFTHAMLERLWQHGRAFKVGVYGVEALMLMRLEKGFIHLGADTDGNTMPQDIGMARGIERKAANFVGRRSLTRAAARDPQRMQLVGLVPVDRRTRLPVGAHLAAAPPPGDVDGFVTSSGFSPMLRQPVALAMLKRGSARIGERLRLFDGAREIAVEVAKPPFFDPAGDRLHG